MALSAPQVAIQTLPLDTILTGDCLDVLRTLPDNSVDAIVTDPPAGISFMSRTWDSDHGGRDHWIQAFAAIYRECLRVLKPGGHALVWALPRTSHWTATALEDAGFEIRDRVSHFFGSGFPKSLDVSKAMDKQAGARRDVVGVDRRRYRRDNAANNTYAAHVGQTGIVTAPATDDARTWDGWGTALKPAVEDWWLVRKPLSERNVAANVLRWGTGALNIAASRVAHDGRRSPAGADGRIHRTTQNTYGKATSGEAFDIAQGRWPSHLLLSHSIWCSDGGCDASCPIAALDAQSGTSKSSDRTRQNKQRGGVSGIYNDRTAVDTHGHSDIGGSSRYFQQFAYVPKASRSERNRGCDALPEKSPWTSFDGQYAQSRNPVTGERLGEYKREQSNSHPTVKPLALMTWLIRLITPAGGVVLDPFAGSGSTLVAAQEGGWRYLGIEREAEYVAIAQARLAPPALPAFAVTAKKPRRKKVSA